MNAPVRPNPKPVAFPVTPPDCPEFDDIRRVPGTSKVGTPGRILVLCFGSAAVMAPWPLLGILLTHPWFDEASEAFMLFGGLTLVPLMILALFGSVPEEVLIALMMLVWMAAAAVPTLWLRRRLKSWWAVASLLTAQMLFSIAQAAMGALLILGKNV